MERFVSRWNPGLVRIAFLRNGGWMGSHSTEMMVWLGSHSAETLDWLVGGLLGLVSA